MAANLLVSLFTQAHTLQQEGMRREAITAYRHLLSQYPMHIASRYNLGSLLAEQHDWTHAISELEQVFKQESNCTPACYNLAICWQAQGDDKQASQYLERTLALEPHHPFAAQALGSILLKQEHYDQAKTYLIAALSIAPTDADIYFNLGLACLGEGNKTGALYYFSELLKFHPEHVDAHYNCAVIYQQQGNYPAALRAYDRVLRIHPQHFAALYNSAIIFQATEEYVRALQYYQRAYALQPQHKTLPFLISALQQQLREEMPLQAPTEYIETLFDSYSDHYDQHMQQQLQYTVPQQLFELFSHYAKPEQVFALVDLGCGTGLVGKYFYPFCHTLVGIDISTNMLRQASLKKYYTTLSQQDNVHYLKKLHEDLDMVVAADVLGYSGDLQELFSAIKQALRAEGWWLFSIENYSGHEDFHLQQNARFAHKTEYIEKLAHENQFTIVTVKSAILRLQQEQPVLGSLYLLRK